MKLKKKIKKKKKKTMMKMKQSQLSNVLLMITSFVVLETVGLLEVQRNVLVPVAL